MASSDFVLDEGLDDDEDVLAFYSQQERVQPTPAADLNGDTSTPDNTSDETPPQPQPDPPPAKPKQNLDAIPPECTAVILDQMPLQSSRSDVDQFLHGCGQIIALKVRHLESKGYMQARVTFDSNQAVQLAVQRSATPFGHQSSRNVIVRPVKSDAVAQSNCTQSDKGAAALARQEVAKMANSLPPVEAVSSSFWSMFGAAKKAAGALEERAKLLGERLENQLHVGDKVQETRQRIAQMDSEYQVSQRMGEMAAAGRATAGDLDHKMGISKGVGAVSESVGSAAKIVAREVDENLDLSGRARQAANVALQNEALGPTVKSVVASIGGVGSPRPMARAEAAVEGDNVTPRRRKNYQPSGVEPETLNMDAE